MSAQPPVDYNALKLLELEGDQRIDAPVSWTQRHVVIKGNLTLVRGGRLRVSDSLLEIRGDWARQYALDWQGGTLYTRRSVIGGSKRDGTIRQINLQLTEGEWIAEDTMVQYVYGTVFGWNTVGRLRARNLIMGENPDSIIMSGRGDVVLEQSTFPISLSAYVWHGGDGRLRLRRDRALSGVYDARNVPGAPWRLRLKEVRVPTWWLFAMGARDSASPCRLSIEADAIIPSIGGADLRGSWRLPYAIRDPVQTGNVTWSHIGEPVTTWGWGVYLSGTSHVTVQGPGNVCELMLGEASRFTLRGVPDEPSTKLQCTTTEIGHGEHDRCRLEVSDARIGWFHSGDVLGQITVTGRGSARFDRCTLDRLMLITRDQGCLWFHHCDETGPITEQIRGGPIYR